MLPRTFRLALLLALLTPAVAKAVEFAYGISPTATGPELRVRLVVDDGFSQESALDASVEPASVLGGGTAQLLGVLDPTWVLENLDFAWDALVFSGSVGDTNLPWELRLGVVGDYLATRSSPFLTPDGIEVFPGGSQQSASILDAGVEGRVLGTLTANGEVFAVDSGFGLLCDACVSGTLLATPTNGSILGFGITSNEAAPLFDEQFIQSDLTWRLQVVSLVNGTEMTLVPEPSTALLLAVGITGLAARRRGCREASRR